MTHFAVDQPIAADPDAVLAAFLDTELYRAFGELPDIAPPEVLERRDEDGTVEIRVRYRFAGSLAAPARAVLDPAKLTWIDTSTFDIAAHRARWRVAPEHYARNLRLEGWYAFLPADGGTTVQHIEADLRVSWPLVGRLVERAIVTGLRQHLAAEAQIVERFIRP